MAEQKNPKSQSKTSDTKSKPKTDAKSSASKAAPADKKGTTKTKK